MRYLIFLLLSLPLFISCQKGGEGENGGEETCLGETRNFWIWDLSVMPPGDVEKEATCRAEGDHAYIYVDNEIWESHVDGEDISEFLKFLESETPEGSVNPDGGIIPNTVDLFGDVPDALDNDPKIYILLTSLEDYEGYSFDGYWNLYDQYPDEKYGQKSNEVEILYIDGVDRKITSDSILSVTAHEFQHMIHWNYDENEESWINESMSELAMVVNGLYTDSGYVRDYLKNPDYQLITDSYVHYGACLLFGVYLWEQFGPDLITSLVRGEGDGISGVETALSEGGIDLDFPSLFMDWAAANYLDDPGLMEGEFGYGFSDLPTVKEYEKFSSYPASIEEREVDASGVDYIKFARPQSYNELHITMDVEEISGYDEVYTRLIFLTEDGVSVESPVEIEEGMEMFSISFLEGVDAETILIITSLGSFRYSIFAEEIQD